jgi:riboflavin kinase / FMN adenylyltransferase
MDVYRTLDEAAAANRPMVFAVGAFDGIHLGHQAVIAAARKLAADGGAQAWAMTFDPHPQKVLRPDEAPELILAPTQKLAVLGELGLDATLLVPFTPALAGIAAEDFVSLVRRKLPGLRGIAAGENWRFGRGAFGDARLLQSLGRALGFAVVTVPRVSFAGEPVSSSRIRAAVAGGRVEDAAAMLGRPFRLTGSVVPGRKVGHQLGFPTANLRAENELRPGAGIYAARATADGRTYPAAAYRGRGGAGGDVVEVHLLDFDGDLYGKTLDVDLVAHLREDRRFVSMDDLKAQIAKDVAAIRARLASPS